MTVALIKTKAEQALAADFAVRGGHLPDLVTGEAQSAAARTKAMATFEALGLPHRRVEAWKYTDLRANIKDFAPFALADETHVTRGQLDAALGPLATLDADRIVFVNGRHRPELSADLPLRSAAPAGGDLPVPPGRADVNGAHDAVARDAVSGEAIVALNAALTTGGVDIVVDRSRMRAILLVSVAAGPHRQLSSLCHRITLHAGVSATVIEAHVTVSGSVPGQSNTVCRMTVGDGASLSHSAIGLEGSAALHLQTLYASLGADATFRSFQLTAGTGLARTQSFVEFRGENASLDISGLMLARGHEHIDTTLVIDHALPHCTSRELFKAVLEDSGRAVFQGKVIVRPDAQKTDGKQMAKALMLSEACEFDSKPELEIYADDVVCGHGATVAEIDPDAMFYLQSRGIPAPEAKAMLIESFAGEALDKVDDETLRETLMVIVRGWLDQAAAT